MNVEDVFNNGLTALLPVYDDGNVTRVFTHNGEQALVRKTCKTVLKNLARFYGVDLAATGVTMVELSIRSREFLSP